MAAIKISFDAANNPEEPIFILATKSGHKLGALPARDIVCSDSLKEASEFTFKVHKYTDGVKCALWDKLVNFKLVWCKNYNVWFEIKVETDEAEETLKTVYGTRLGQAELSQIQLYDIEINTEDDIKRKDYDEKYPTILYREDHPEASLLHRIMEKAPHYSIVHVDDTLKKDTSVRTFSFDSTSLYDAFQEIEEEIGCLFVFHSDSDSNGRLRRAISVYDLESNCLDCGHRGEFSDMCPKCASKHITEGYGQDTTIFVTADELGDDIHFSTDTDSVKNCFKLEAGDDLMTATIRNCNPNGTDYIWLISPDMKKDMSKELVAELEKYDKKYNDYEKDYIVNISDTIRKEYNKVVEKYQEYKKDLQLLPVAIKGYSGLMEAYYQAIDLSGYLTSAFMPTVEMSGTNIQEQAKLLITKNLSPVSVEDVSKLSKATANSVVLGKAKLIIDSRYKVKITPESPNLSNQTWTGTFTITNCSDEKDTVVTDKVTVEINDDLEIYLKQNIEEVLNKEKVDDLSISALFKKEIAEFAEELKKYCMKRLLSFRDACQSVIAVLTEQGVSNEKTWSGSNEEDNLYKKLYKPYRKKLEMIEAEINTRQDEINIINGVYDSDGNLVKEGLKSAFDSIRDQIQKDLDFQTYLGEYWPEFCLYRREDKYTNDNYKSDGLNNAELFEKTLKFIEEAKKEIYKSSELQHSISCKLKNLLVIKKFEPLVKYFEVGNWIRVRVDDQVYKLRLLKYEIDFNNLNDISVDFSDVMKTAYGETDQKSLMQKVSSMATSYNSVKRQASQGEKSKEILNNWAENGLDATQTKIIGGANNQTQTWDEHGMLFRKYNAFTDTYDDNQLKIINSTIAITNDNWKTSKTAIGNFLYKDPKDPDGKLLSGYGINAETIVGRLILGEQLQIYNESGKLSFDNNGFKVTNDKNTIIIDPNPTDGNPIFNIKNDTKDILSFNEAGDLSIVGDITASTLKVKNSIYFWPKDNDYDSENYSAELIYLTPSLDNGAGHHYFDLIIGKENDVESDENPPSDNARLEFGIVRVLGNLVVGGTWSSEGNGGYTGGVDVEAALSEIKQELSEIKRRLSALEKK